MRMKILIESFHKYVRRFRVHLPRTMIALFAFYSVLFTCINVASACTPVAYLFRHAEDQNRDKSDPFELTLTPSGQAHADLYIGMMNKFQQEKPSYCPVSTVYALNPIKFFHPGGRPEIGTSNPYWTAEPLAQRATNQNPIITVDDMILTETLGNGVGAKFLEAIEAKVNNQQSVAIFWTSDGMCDVAKTLGPTLPGFSCTSGSKPPRNSVFRFNYDVVEKKFKTVTDKYKQCFNYNATADNFTPDTYYCQFSANLNTYETRPGFADDLEQIAGRICDTAAPDPTCILE
jgi:hypothetical protein